MVGLLPVLQYIAVHRVNNNRSVNINIIKTTTTSLLLLQLGLARQPVKNIDRGGLRRIAEIILWVSVEILDIAEQFIKLVFTMEPVEKFIIGAR